MGTSAPGPEFERALHEPPHKRAAQDWAPQECTLSPAGRQARAAEFSETFAETVLRVERPEETRLRLELEPGPASAGRIAALASAETSCCSFFTFTLTATAGSLSLDVAVPAAQLPVLDALAERAAANLRGPGQAALAEGKRLGR
jgi:hypothetical protein